MQQIPISNIPNQSLSFSADGSYWEFRLYQGAENMLIDIARNSELIISGFRCVEGSLLIPFDYLWDPISGNLVFDSVPNWENFGITCFLYYLGNSEAKEWQARTQITEVL